MLLEGSCHCQSVRFSCESRHPTPYQRCYCSICRKTGGGGGFMINILADASTLKVVGKEHTSIYRATVERDGKKAPSRHQRHFCKLCGSHLWAFHERWPDFLYPVASAIDTSLETAPEYVHMMTSPDSRASWVALDETIKSARFENYPQESLADWHRARDLEVD